MLGIDECFVWLAAGRLERAKNYPTLFRAFQQLQNRITQKMVLLVCGRGSLDSQLRGLVRELGIDQQVRFLGTRADMPQIFSASDALVMSSVREGLPMVLLEASACGLPIVATTVGGNSEIVIEGKTGFLVQPNDPIGLAMAMERVVQLPSAEREKMAHATKLHVKDNFDMEAVADCWQRLYLDLISRRLYGSVGVRGA
jgi:glycosyltransferase involved in cell wall biosynthesis